MAVETISLQEALKEVPPKGSRSQGGVCFYCRKYATRIEWDHFPIAYEFGGERVVPSCLTCHDLKDRQSIMDWPAEMIREAFEGLTPMAALLLGKAVRVMMAVEATEDQRQPRRERG